MMNKSIFIFVLLAISLTLATASGCRIIQPVLDFVFQSPNATNPVSGAESPARQLLNAAKKSSWINTLAIPIIALGAVAMFNGAMKLGMSAIIFGTVNLFMALATARFALWMAIFGLVGSTAAVVLSILIKNKALKDVVNNVQVIKAVAKENTSAEVYNSISNELKVQAGTTKKLVNKIKTKANSFLNHKET